MAFSCLPQACIIWAGASHSDKTYSKKHQTDNCKLQVVRFVVGRVEASLSDSLGLRHPMKTAQTRTLVVAPALRDGTLL